MDERGKSDGPVVPAKLPNKAVEAAAEAVEERGPAKGSTDSTTHPGRSAGHDAPSGLDRVREVERRDKEARFTALLHHVTPERLRWAYWAIRPQAAPGVDGVTWAAYVNDGRILTLWRRLKIDPCMVVFNLLVAGCGGRGDAAEVSVFEPVAVSFEGHLRNAKLQLTAVLAPGEEVPGLYLHPDHRRRLRRAAARSALDV